MSDEHREAIADEVAKALYVAAHWPDMITERDSDRRSDDEYKRRSEDHWDSGMAGWSRYQTYPRLADAAREALKPRTITTAEELNGLAVGAVVLADGYLHHANGMPIAFQRWSDGDWHRGARSGSTHPDNIVPATVIHEPRA